jgi:TolB-like protein/DNA-binding winged helix-turn-helix (wHTH) protein
VQPERQLSVIRFGVYEVFVRSGELRKAGRTIRIQQQPLKLLRLLLEHPGEVVTREELRNRLWPDESFGDFDQAVNAAIGKVRSALGDSADNPRFVETVPKHGYRFIAEVALEYVESPSETGPSVGEDSTNLPGGPADLVVSPSNGRGRRFAVAGIVVAFIVLAAFAWLAIWKARPHSGGKAKIRSLAVLPLENLSGDPSQDFFADGMTDELITDLARIRALRVISRTSVTTYKGTRKSLPQIGRELNVDAVVEGSVARSGDRVRITVQLIRAAADEHLWADSYEGDMRDSLALQNKVARTIPNRYALSLPRKRRECSKVPKP